MRYSHRRHGAESGLGTFMHTLDVSAVLKSGSTMGEEA